MYWEPSLIASFFTTASAGVAEARVNKGYKYVLVVPPVMLHRSTLSDEVTHDHNGRSYTTALPSD